jgi:phosphate transport system substrate-binding protein
MTPKRRTNRNRFTWLFALFAVVALFAAACSSDSDTAATDEGDDSTTTTEAAGPAPSDADIEALTVSIAGGGASFPDAYYQAVNADFNGIAGTERVTYAKSGSSDGRAQLAAGTVDYAGSDSLPKDTETFNGTLLFFPTVAAPITVSYNLEGVDELNLSADVIAGIFQAEITTWDDAKIKADNPDAELPATAITVVHRSDGSGTTNNFTKFLTAAAPDVWKLDSGDEVNWPASTQGAEKNSGVAEVIKQTDGAIGYVDLADAGKAGLTFAAIGNTKGEFVTPSVAGVQAALEGATIEDDLTYNPLNSEGEGAYPITAPTWLLVLAEQTDAGKAETLKTYLQYVLTTGQEAASSTGYVALPSELAEKALAQIDSIQG